MVKYRVQQEKMMDFNNCEEYLKGLYQTKYYYGNVKKNTFSFSSDLQIDKKINNVKEDFFYFSQALPSAYKVLIRSNVT